MAAVQHFTLEVENLFTTAKTLTPIFQLLLVMMPGNLKKYIPEINAWKIVKYCSNKGQFSKSLGF